MLFYPCWTGVQPRRRMMSRTSATYPIVGAIKIAEQILGPDRQWSVLNDQQKKFLADYFSICRTEIAKIPEIESLASKSAEEINAFLCKRGFDIRLDPFDANEFGTASVLNVLVEWLQEGKKTALRAKSGREFPAVKLASDFLVFSSNVHRHPVACLATKSSTDRVFITVAEKPLDGFDLPEAAMRISQSLDYPSARYESLTFPMVDLDQKVDISWLKGMATQDAAGLPWEIAMAFQQTKFKMNEKGARAKSAVAIMMRTLSIPQRMVIDEPFLVWIERQGLSRPLFVGYITEDDWKDPGSLGD